MPKEKHYLHIDVQEDTLTNSKFVVISNVFWSQFKVLLESAAPENVEIIFNYYKKKQ